MPSTLAHRASFQMQGERGSPRGQKEKAPVFPQPRLQRTERVLSTHRVSLPSSATSSPRYDGDTTSPVHGRVLLEDGAGRPPRPYDNVRWWWGRGKGTAWRFTLQIQSSSRRSKILLLLKSPPYSALYNLNATPCFDGNGLKLATESHFRVIRDSIFWITEDSLTWMLQCYDCVPKPQIAEQKRCGFYSQSIRQYFGFSSTIV